ncbi:hypothetical protein [Mesorhizobium sp.]|uniref:hypothetical protein n=1 Tax=Mesorhizobium sp. TaxID=1871066 RepID=UPI00122598C3|nr:hypothetical protein [Mesorhizobium sp.]TIN79756.1 MAG: hypothetical protein E5Y09_04785 [Mesorhizobium sp.]
MSVQRDIAPDLAHPKICPFLNDFDPKTKTFSLEGENKNERQSQGYTLVDTKEIHTQKQVMMTCLARTFDVISTQSGRVILTSEIFDPIEHHLSLEIWAILFLKDELDKSLSEEIIKIFKDTNPADPATDLEAIETRIIRAGANMSDYQVDLVWRLTKVEAPIMSTLNSTAFRELVESVVDENGRAYHRVREQQQTRLTCEMPKHNDDEEIIVCKDLVNPIECIAKREPIHEGCSDLVYTDQAIGTVFQYYEWKVEWLVRPVKIGRCTIMKTRIPVFFSRITKQVLWGYTLTLQQTKDNFERQMKECILWAAGVTAVAVLVAGGMGIKAAANAFSTALMTCLEQKLDDAVECVFGSMRLVAQSSGWEEKIF